MGKISRSRISTTRILSDLRLAARQGDRAALTLAVSQMKTLALSPRYWERYLGLLRDPLARLVDLLVVKQGERIARQKGRSVLPSPSAPTSGRRPSRSPAAPRRRTPAAEQPDLFDR